MVSMKTYHYLTISVGRTIIRLPMSKAVLMKIKNESKRRGASMSVTAQELLGDALKSLGLRR